MAAQIDLDKCTMCGGLTEPLCVEVCPDLAIRIQDGRPVVTEFLCEDCSKRSHFKENLGIEALRDLRSSRIASALFIM
jgi:MinD superfamily P-loop ATPase